MCFINGGKVLQVPDCRNLDPEKILAEISKEQNFDVTYVDIDEKTEDGDVQCLVQETSFIPTVSYLTVWQIQICFIFSIRIFILQSYRIPENT